MKSQSARIKRHHFSRERDIDRVTGLGQPKTVSIELAQLTRLLIDATHTNRAWLKDFADDCVKIDADLYEVLLAYQSIRNAA